MLAVSGLDVAFISALAAVAAAIAAPLSAWLVAVANHRHDRWVKTYEDLRDAYQRTLRDLYMGQMELSAYATALEEDTLDRFVAERRAAYGLEGDEQDRSGDPLSEDISTRASSRAALGLFASPQVSAAVDDWNTAWDAVARAGQKSRHALKHGTDADRKASAETMKVALSNSNSALRRVGQAMRDDVRRQ